MEDKTAGFIDFFKEIPDYRMMALALRCQYFMQGSLRQKANQLNISHTQFKYYVDMAHQWLVGIMSINYLINDNRVF